MKKWKQIYELFKQHPGLDEMDKQFIAISEKILSLNKPHLNKLAYSRLWQENWIRLTNYRLFVEKRLLQSL